jgi:nucleoside-diphosphate-sugar epimerase
MASLIFGCGYLGARVAARWLAVGETVYAVTRRAERVAELRERGIEAIVADVTDATSLARLPIADNFLFAVGFDRAAGHSIEDVYVAGLRNVLDALPEQTARIVYISSTGVYGQNDGSWVDEDSPCEPDRNGGRACLAAEQLLAGHARGARATILRLAGIYGPSRVPRIADLRAGQPILGSSEGYLNLIHVDDAAVVVQKAADRDGELRTFTVSDGQPVLRREYFEYLAQLGGAPRPTFEDETATSAKRARGTTSKRVSNRRIMQELGVTFRYPSYREGLRSIVNESDV